MKLGTLFFVVSAVAMTGCASTCPSSPTVAAAPTSTTRLTSAELPETEFAPLVGKPQHATSGLSIDDEASPKDGHHRSGSGFSGYK